MLDFFQKISYNDTVVVLIAVVLVMLVLGFHFRGQQRRLRVHYRQQDAENRMGKRYLDDEDEEIVDSRPITRRARWMMIMSTISIVMLLYIGFKSTE